MNTIGSGLLIGDLLRSAKIVELHDLTHAVQVANKTGLPVGRVLVMLGMATSETVHAALQAQSLVRDRLVSAETAVKALTVVAAYRVDLERALEQIGSLPPKTVESNKLGDLLVLSGLITDQQLADALKTAQHLNLPLGRMLVLKNILREHVVEAALDAQIMLRDGIINRKQAVEALKSARLKHLPIENCLKTMGLELAKERQSVRIGELFVLAEIVSEADLLTALEIGLLEGQQIGQVLLKFGFLNSFVLDSALSLQAMVQRHRLSVQQAVEVLRQVAREGTDIAHAVASLVETEVNPVEAVGLAELLHLTGLVPQEDTERSLAISYASKIPFNQVLVQYKLIEERVLQVAIRCQLLMSEELLSAEQAIVALHQFAVSGLELIEILANMNWMEDERRPVPIILGSTPVTH